MVFPWMFEEVHALRKFKDAAHLLAEKKDWPPLYDIAVLNNNKVPVNLPYNYWFIISLQCIHIILSSNEKISIFEI